MSPDWLSENPERWIHLIVVLVLQCLSAGALVYAKLRVSAPSDPDQWSFVGPALIQWILNCNLLNSCIEIVLGFAFLVLLLIDSGDHSRLWTALQIVCPLDYGTTLLFPLYALALVAYTFSRNRMGRHVRAFDLKGGPRTARCFMLSAHSLVWVVGLGLGLWVVILIELDTGFGIAGGACGVRGAQGGWFLPGNLIPIIFCTVLLVGLVLGSRVLYRLYFYATAVSLRRQSTRLVVFIGAELAVLGSVVTSAFVWGSVANTSSGFLVNAVWACAGVIHSALFIWSERRWGPPTAVRVVRFDQRHVADGYMAKEYEQKHREQAMDKMRQRAEKVSSVIQDLVTEGYPDASGCFVGSVITKLLALEDACFEQISQELPVYVAQQWEVRLAWTENARRLTETGEALTLRGSSDSDGEEEDNAGQDPEIPNPLANGQESHNITISGPTPTMGEVGNDAHVQLI